MPRFQFTTDDHYGNESVDIINASSKADALRQLRVRGIRDAELVEVSAPKDPVTIIDVVITLIRIPLCLTAIALIAFSHAIHFVIETVIAIIWLPIAATVQSRSELRGSWLATYPNIFQRGYDYHASLPNSRYEDFFLIKSGLRLIWWALFPPKGCFQSIRTAITWVGRD